MRKRTYIQWTFLLLVSPNEGLYHFVVLPTSTSIKILFKWFKETFGHIYNDMK